jgi:hypothetical protein
MEVVKNELPTMTNRILPNRDFKKVIEHDKIYLGILNEILEFSVIEQDVLGKKSIKILSKQTKETITKEINTLVRWAEVKKKCLDTKAQIIAHEKLINDKTEHYKRVFLPQWEKEIKETNTNFDKYIKQARTLVKEKPKSSEEFVKKLIEELHWFDCLKPQQKKEDEYKLNLYKPIKRIVNAYQKSLLKKRTVV